MALKIKNPGAERLADELAEPAGETETEAVRLTDELEEIARHCSRLPVLDNRSAEEILVYDRDGVPR